MMHKAWSGTEEVPYCFSSSSIRFQGHTGRQIIDLVPVFERFRAIIHGWLRNDTDSSRSMKDEPYCFSKSSIKFQGYTGQKMIELDPIWAFVDSNSNCFRGPIIFSNAIHSILLETDRGKNAETFGLDDTFPSDDLASGPWTLFVITYMYYVS